MLVKFSTSMSLNFVFKFESHWTPITSICTWHLANTFYLIFIPHWLLYYILLCSNILSLPHRFIWRAAKMLLVWYPCPEISERWLFGKFNTGSIIIRLIIFCSILINVCDSEQNVFLYKKFFIFSLSFEWYLN